MPKITPFLWFDTEAEDAMNFYASIFKRSKVISVNRARGRVMSVQFELEGQEFMALNAGPAVQVHRGHLVLRRLRDAGGNRRAVDEAPRRRRRAQPLRLAQGQVRAVVADRPQCARPHAGRRRRRTFVARPAGNAADDEARHRGAAEGVRRAVVAGRSPASAALSSSLRRWPSSLCRAGSPGWRCRLLPGGRSLRPGTLRGVVTFGRGAGFVARTSDNS